MDTSNRVPPGNRLQFARDANSINRARQVGCVYDGAPDRARTNRAQYLRSRQTRWRLTFDGLTVDEPARCRLGEDAHARAARGGHARLHAELHREEPPD